MPVYQCAIPQGLMAASLRPVLARELTRLHCEATGVPQELVQVLFMDVPEGCAFAGGQAAQMSNVAGYILAGRSPSVRAQLFAEINRAWIGVTGLPVEQLKVTLFDVPAAWVMQGGRMMPEPNQLDQRLPSVRAGAAVRAVRAPSQLFVRRSVHISASPERVWRELESLERMVLWWGLVKDLPEAGKGNGQRLVAYEPRVGARIEMEVLVDGEPARYGGTITVFDPARELAFESDWVPNRGWQAPTLLTIRLSAALEGTLVEILHSGFEHTGLDAGQEHANYESGWGMTQLNALRALVGGC